MNKIFFVSISDGEYSDFTQDFYYGPREITEKEFEDKAKWVGDFILDWFETLPGEGSKRIFEGQEIGRYTLGQMWLQEMEAWLEKEGFKKIPENTPDLHRAYGNMPNSRGWTP